jgi:predicted acylesterase/phospholipase RssA
MNYDLVFEGGGAKGMVFVGAMQAFEEQKHTYDRLLGTSAGAITAALLAAGYGTDEMLRALSEQEDGAPVFAGFMGEPAPFSAQEIESGATRTLLRNIQIRGFPRFVKDRLGGLVTKALLGADRFRNFFSLIERGGWYSAHKFVVWMQRKLNEGTFQGRQRDFADMSLGAFHEATGRDLSLVASDTTAGRMMVLNHRTAPSLPLVWAVRMSMSIPMLWPEVKWRAEWGTYLDKPVTDHMIVDGGLLSNFPIELLVSADDHITALMGEKRGGDVLGLLIDESKAVPNAPPKPAGGSGSLDLSQLQIAQRIGRLANTLTGAHDKMVIEALEEYVVRLPAADYGTTEFNMDPPRRDALVRAGYEEMDAFLKRLLARPLAAPLDEAVGVSVAQHADRIASRILSW